MTKDEILAAASVIVSKSDMGITWSTHVKLCELLSAEQSSVSNGVMALVWTALHELTSHGLAQADASAVLRTILEKS